MADAAQEALIELLTDIDAHLEHELVLMEGNYGLSGHETDEEIEDESDMPALSDMRTALGFRGRIAEQLARLKA